MKRLSPIVLAVVLIGAIATACFDDPTSSLRNGPARLDLSRTAIFINLGDSLSVNAGVKDEQGNVFSAAGTTWESADPTVATVRVDDIVIPNNAFSRAFVLAVAAGRTYVRVTSQGVSDSVLVWVLPLVFNGTVSPASFNVGDTLTITASTALGFSTAAAGLSEVTVGGVPAWILSRTASQIKAIAPMADAGSAVSITNVVLLGTVAIASLDATTTVTVTEANEPGNDDPATPTAMTLYTDKYGTVGSSDVDDFFRFTTPATGDSVDIEVLWNTDSDIDVLLLDATASDLWDCTLDACHMVTGNIPEATSVRLAANTTYQILVEMYDAASAGSDPVLFRIRTTKVQ